MMAPGEVGELDPGSGGDDHVAGVRIVQRSPAAHETVGISEERLVATASTGRETDLLAVAARAGFITFAKAHGFRGLLLVGPAGEVARLQLAARKPAGH